MAVYTSLPETEILVICERFGLRLVGYEPISAGGANSNYLVHARRGSYVLTMAEEKSVEQIAELGNLLAYLNRRDFTTNRLVPAIDGNEVIEVLGKPVFLKEYINGETVEDLTQDMLLQVGQAMARLHQIPVPEFVAKRGQYGFQAYEVMNQSSAISEQLSWARERIASFESLRPAGLPRGLIHADVFSDNLLWENGRLQALIDFEEAHSGELVLDLALAIVGMCADGERVSIKKSRALISGYSQVRELEPEEQAVLQAVTEYAAVLVSCWRYWKHNIYTPSTEKADHYLTMVRLAKRIRAMPKAEWAPVFMAELDA